MTKLSRPPRIGYPHPGIPGVCEIPLTQGKFALVDAEDFAAVSLWSWCAIKGRKGVSWYAHANTEKAGGGRRYVKMHRYVLQPLAGLEIDHVDGDGLNNRRSNLRISTRQENSRNVPRHRDGSSRFKGVSWYRRDSCWRSCITVNDRQIHLGYFQDEAEAAAAYDAAAVRLFGEFARLNS